MDTEDPQKRIDPPPPNLFLLPKIMPCDSYQFTLFAFIYILLPISIHLWEWSTFPLPKDYRIAATVA